MTQPFLITALAASLVTQALAQSPTLQHAMPSAVTPGKSIPLSFAGERLMGKPVLWTSFPCETTWLADATGDAPQWQVVLPPDSPIGIGAVRVAATNGVSNLQLLMIDDLPTMTGSETNTSLKTAQEIHQPIAIDGQCDELAMDYYRLAARSGDELAIEVVAHRLGSDLDPVLRLLDADGRELAYCDDAPGAAADARIRHRFAASGDYFLEVRDTRYRGGAKYRYRLRVGQFPFEPLPILAMPGNAREQWMSVRPQFSEVEPNSTAATATRIRVPALVRGRFDRAHDRDWYAFDVQKGQRLVFEGKTRSLGSPCDLTMRLFKEDESFVAEANIAGANEGTLTNTFAEAGTFRLLVEELNGGGAPEYFYEIGIRPLEPGFDLSVETDKVEAPAGGTFELKVTAARREYDGPIVLALTGDGENLEIENPLLPAKKTEATLKVTMPKSWKSDRIRHFTIVGYARIGGRYVEAMASTMPAVRKLFPMMLYPPQEFDGWIALGVRSAPEPAKVTKTP